MPITALVTGANRGLGLEWVRQLIDEVDQLYATCRAPAEADELRAFTETHRDTVDVLGLDVTDDAAIDDVVDRVRREQGALHLLVNNAGISGGATSDCFGNVDAETMTEVLRVNAVGPHLMTQAFADLLAAGADERGTATVVNVTSQLGSIERTSGGGWHSYKASKAALNMGTRLQATELKGDDVIVVAMHPGWVRTDMGGANARLSTEESVTGMLEVLYDLQLSHSGQFLAYDGDELPW
ncbi:MAG: hypothetical protein BRD55_04810 [Bacteroidetes bacterium SW_9_63_38]|nr:MAG: hypothetical protein BRD55_04810 [Bacteroidetes bacterium SW_9_63_38]